jgi:hypothetical protein
MAVIHARPESESYARIIERGPVVAPTCLARRPRAPESLQRAWRGDRGPPNRYNAPGEATGSPALLAAASSDSS